MKTIFLITLFLTAGLNTATASRWDNFDLATCSLKVDKSVKLTTEAMALGMSESGDQEVELTYFNFVGGDNPHTLSGLQRRFMATVGMLYSVKYCFVGTYDCVELETIASVNHRCQIKSLKSKKRNLNRPFR